LLEKLFIETTSRGEKDNSWRTMLLEGKASTIYIIRLSKRSSKEGERLPKREEGGDKFQISATLALMS